MRKALPSLTKEAREYTADKVSICAAQAESDDSTMTSSASHS